MNNQFKHNSQVGHGIGPADFDEFGLRWPANHLDHVFPAIITWPPPLQAQYVDRTVFEIVSKGNQDELDILCKNIQRNSYGIEGLNTTTIGNLAFAFMYAPCNNLRVAASIKLNKCIGELVFGSQKPISNKSFGPIGQA